ncbi:MAG: hypothetical protein J6W37_08925, partial [Bacteroidales bacterium]|nr:hypothetical protein [Bacteroidales bacterium]
MKRLFVIAGLVIASITTAFGQSVVAGTDFSQKAKYMTADEWRQWDFSTINKYGAESATALTSAFNYVTDGSDIKNGEAAWTIVPNPYQLDGDGEMFPDIEDDMYVSSIKGKSANANLLSFSVSGLKPGTSYSVTMKVYLLYTTCTNSWDQSLGFLLGVPDDYGNMNGATNSGTLNPTDVGVEKTLTFSGTLGAAQSTVNFELHLGYNFNSNSIFGISDIQISGTINPFVVSGQGKEMCRGEQTLLSLDKDYGESASIKWEKSSNGSNWSVASYKSSLYDEVTASKMYYRATVNGVTTPSLEVTTVTCCETVVDGNTVYSSRETVYFEDFGHFTGEHEYVSTDGTTSTTPSNWIMHRNDCPFSMPSGAGSFDATGQVNDGSYAVVVPTSQGYKTDYWATWMTGNGAITQDHSSMIDGVENSACLFMNVKHNFEGNVFEHEITGLCTGKKLTFECYVGNMSDGTSPIISLYIKNRQGTVLGKVENFSPGKGAGWQRVVIDDLILTETDIVFEIYSGSDGSGYNFWDKGCDLCIDDIKIMACSSPALDLFSNVDDLERITYVCSDPLVLGSVASNLLSSYYGSTLQYLFQYSKTPDVETSWVDITKSASSTYTIQNPKESQIFDGLRTGESVYFRVVAATANTLNTTSVFSQTNYCKNYSISPSVEVIMDCPTCSSPKPLTIYGDELLCPGETGQLTVSEQANATTFSYTWYKGSISDANIVAGPTTAATLPLNISYTTAGQEDDYFVLVKDVAFPTLTSCQQQAQWTVLSNVTPEVTIAGGTQEVCVDDVASLSDVTFTFTGRKNWKFTYSDGTQTYTDVTARTDTYTIPAPTAIGEYTYTVSALKDRKCTATSTPGSATIKIKPVPTATLTANPTTICVDDGTITLTAASDQSDARFIWSDGASAAGAIRNFSAVNESGTYGVTASLDGCSSDATPVTITINAKPEIKTLTSDVAAVCSGETINLSATVSDSGDGTFTWSGDGVTGSGSTATVT